MGDRIPLTPVDQGRQCCEPLCPDACGPAGSEASETPVKTEAVTARDKVVKLTKARVERLFHGEDDEIFTREDLMEDQPDGTLKVTGACSGTIWLVQKSEIAVIQDE